jgi:hypothetical protein
MASVPASVLAINGGSSSIKFAVRRAGTLPTLSLSGTLDRIGRSGTTLSWRAKEGASVEGHTEVPDDTPAPRLLIDWQDAREEFADVSAVGHRVVHGMAHTEPIRVTPDVVDQLRRATSYAPDHLPLEIALIEAFRERHPHLPLLIHRLTYRRTNHHNLHVRGYKEEGTTTTPFDMVVLNDLDRFHLVADVIDRVPALGPRAAYAQQAIRDKLIEHQQYIARHGEDMPEIRNWRWSLGTAAQSARRPSGSRRRKRS